MSNSSECWHDSTANDARSSRLSLYVSLNAVTVPLNIVSRSSLVRDNYRTYSIYLVGYALLGVAVMYVTLMRGLSHITCSISGLGIL